MIEGLDLLYLDETYAINDIMSRADYWQLAGIAGIEMAIAISNRKCSDDDVRYAFLRFYMSQEHIRPSCSRIWGETFAIWL